MSAGDLIEELSHLRLKPMWAGSNNKSEYADSLNTFTIHNNSLDCFSVKTLGAMPYAKIKCYDELIVNAVDHIAACRDLKYDEQVSYINVSFDKKTFEFSIENDGKGIDIVRLNAPGTIYHGLYKPYVFFTSEKQGSNAHKKGSCIKAGTNGYGTKIVLAHSEYMRVECLNARQGLLYSHEHRNDPMTGNYVLDKNPQVSQVAAARSFTRITWKPITKGPAATKKVMSPVDFYNWIIYRLVYITSYVNSFIGIFKVRPVRILFNGIDISWIKLADIARSMSTKVAGNSKILEYTIVPAKKEVTIENNRDEEDETFTLLPMELVICLKDEGKKHSIISNTNGTLITEGEHMTSLMNQIMTSVSAKFSSMTDNEFVRASRSSVFSSCVFFVNAIVPDLEFAEQSKRHATLNDVVCQQYSLKPEQIDEIVQLIFSSIIDGISQKVQKKIKEKIKISNKFTDAPSKSRDRSDFILIIAEGDSALGPIEANIGALKKVYDIDKIGYMTLLGGVRNSRKGSLKMGSGSIIVDNKTMNNVFINTFQRATGLVINEPFDYNKLRYKKIVCCLDQDHDGKGKLFGLVTNIIDYFWPELLSRGDILYRFETPIKKVFGRGRLVREFYYEHEYDAFVRDGLMKSSYNIEYFKGLGSHGSYMRNIMANFFGNIRPFRHDQKSPGLYSMFYSKDAEPRKEILCRSPVTASKYYQNMDISMKKEGKVLLTDYILSDLFLFAKDDILRKLVHSVDGLNKSSRKIISGLMALTKSGKDNMKLVEMASRITDSQNYHHGESCLENNIKGKCFISVGGRQVPLILPSGHYGTRLCGGKTASSARYIRAIINKKLLGLVFPKEDTKFLKWTPEDDEYYEPDYFVPILPMSILETFKTTAHGWNFRIVARDAFYVIRLVRQMINGHEPDMHCIPMARHGFSGKYFQDYHSGREVTYGNYTIQKGKIIIDEIPMYKWGREYVKELEAKLLYYRIDGYLGTPDLSEDNKFYVVLHTGPEFWEKIGVSGDLVDMTKISKDNVEFAFGKDDEKKNDRKKTISDTDLSERIKESGIRQLSHGQKFSLSSLLCLKKIHQTSLNMIDVNDRVIYFKEYQDIIRYWFPIRRDLYTIRVIQEKAIKYIHLELLKDQIKFLDMYDFVKRSEEEQINEFIRLGLRAFNTNLLRNPGTTRGDDLLDMCISDGLNEPCNYDYILDMSLRNSNTTSRVLKLKEKLINEMYDYYKLCALIDQGSFPGAYVWLNELNELEKELENGTETWWESGKNNTVVPQDMIVTVGL